MNTYKKLAFATGLFAILIVTIGAVIFISSFILDDFALFAGGSTILILGVCCATPVFLILTALFWVLGTNEANAERRHRELLDND